MNSLYEQPSPRALLDEGDPAADSRAFRRCLGGYPTGVTVITARLGERLVGMAVNSFAAVSLEPALVLWSIRKESRSLTDFLGASHFAVNILAADQVEASQLFGAGHPERFERCAWHTGISGAPLLDQAIAHLECRRTETHEGGDHIVLLGQVERYARFDGTPLVFAQGQYAVTQSHPHLSAKGSAMSSLSDEGPGPSTFLKLLSETQQRMSALFEEHRRELGVTQASTRVLTRLYVGACSLADLERATYLVPESLQDALEVMHAAGLIVPEPEGLYALTELGRSRREAVAQRSAQFTEEKLQGLPREDIEAARRVLLALQLK